MVAAGWDKGELFPQITAGGYTYGVMNLICPFTLRGMVWYNSSKALTQSGNVLHVHC